MLRHLSLFFQDFYMKNLYHLRPTTLSLHICPSSSFLDVRYVGCTIKDEQEDSSTNAVSVTPAETKWLKRYH